MDGFAVVLRCVNVSLIVGVEPTEPRARDLAGSVAAHTEVHLKRLADVYGTRPSAPRGLQLVRLLGGRPVGVEDVALS